MISAQDIQLLSREDLFQLAREKRGHLQTRIAAVCGSHGKSTVKEMLASILNTWNAGRVFASPANQNTKMALATQIVNLPSDCEIAAFEVGARKVDDFEIPFSFLQPHIVALLNIGRAHAGIFGSQADLETTKLSVLQKPCAEILVVPEKSKIFEHAKKTGKRIVTFGDKPEQSILLRWNGPHAQKNAAAAAALAQTLGIPWEDIREGLQSYAGMPGRFEIKSWQEKILVDDAFNASPESMAEGLKQFAHLFGDKPCVLILGSMLELGAECKTIHQEIGSLAFRLMPQAFVISVGEDAKQITQAFHQSGGQNTHHCTTAEEAKIWLTHSSKHWEAAYIKGSKAIGLHKLF